MPRTVIRYTDNGSPQWGVQFGRQIAPLRVDATGTGELLSKHWDRLWSVGPADATLRVDDVRLLSPVTTNQQFICQGVNYRSHIAESGLRIEDFPFNTIFTKAPSCITAADALTALGVIEQECPLGGIHVVVTDLARELFDGIRRGAIAAAIYQRPFMQGRLAVQLLHQQVQTRTLPMGHRRNVAPYAIMRSNLDLVFERAHIGKTNAEGLSDITHAGSDGGRDARGAGSGRTAGGDGRGAGTGRPAHRSARHVAGGRERSPGHLPPARA